MADFEKSVDIDAPLDSVFRFVASAWETDMGFWERGVEDWTPLSPAPLSNGFQVEYVGRMLGIGLKSRMEVREFRTGEGWSAFSIQGPPVRGDWRFEPTAAGTRFTYRLRYTMPPPVIGPLMDRLLIGSLWEKSAEEALGNLKAHVERSVSGEGE